MNVFVGRGSCDAAQEDAFNEESVSRSEYRTDIVQTPHIIQHHDYWDLIFQFKSLDREAVQFSIGELAHAGFIFAVKEPGRRAQVKKK